MYPTSKVYSETEKLLRVNCSAILHILLKETTISAS